MHVPISHALVKIYTSDQFSLGYVQLLSAGVYSSTMDSSLTLTAEQHEAGKMTSADAQRFIKSMTIPHARMAVQTLASICENKRLKPMPRIQAAMSLLDRAFGKPEQMQVVSAPSRVKTGVLLLSDCDGGRDEWLRQAQEHHEEMLK